MKLFFAAKCHPFIGHGHRTNCTENCAFIILYDVLHVINGSCHYSRLLENRFRPVLISCTESTVGVIPFSISQTRINDYVGSVYLTCTEYGWFPPPPTHDNFRVGKYKSYICCKATLYIVYIKYNLIKRLSNI